MEIDRRTLEDLRELAPRDAFERVRRAVYQIPGGVSPEDFQSALEQLVREGILSWDEIERLENR